MKLYHLTITWTGPAKLTDKEADRLVEKLATIAGRVGQYARDLTEPLPEVMVETSEINLA